MFKGIALKIAATFVFALDVGDSSKSAAARYPVGEVVLFRSGCSLSAVLVAWLASRGEFPAALHTRRPLGHVGRSLAGSGGMFANFAALSLLPLAAATAFTFATPLIVVVLAALVCMKRCAAIAGRAVGFGFVGVIVMLSENLGGFGGLGRALLGDDRRAHRAGRRRRLGGGDDPDAPARRNRRRRGRSSSISRR